MFFTLGELFAILRRNVVRGGSGGNPRNYTATNGQN